MVAHAALAVLAAFVIVGSAGAAAVATGAIHIGGRDTFSLGALKAGESGNVSITSSVTLNNTAYYHLEMEKEDHIGNTFSAFTVSVAVNGTTYNLGNGQENNSGFMLSSGTHTFRINLNYTVGNNVVSTNQTDIAFLFLHPSNDLGNQNESLIHDASSFIPVAGSNSSQSENGGQFTLAYISFSVSGVSASSGEDGGTDQVATRQAI